MTPGRWGAGHAVVGGWAAYNVVLASVLLPFGPDPLEILLYLWATALVAAFGLVVLLATRYGYTGVQRRQPRRATSAVLAALGVALGLTGLLYAWWVPLLGLYPLAVAAVLARGERLPAGARPWPVAVDGAEPAGPARYVHHGATVGDAVEVPAGHPAHAPPAPPPARRAQRPTSPRLRAAVGIVGLLRAGLGAVADLLRGRRP